MDQHAEHVSGCAFGLLCVVSAAPLGAQAQTALQSSAVALGYGERALSFVTLGAEASLLEPASVLAVVEAFDPVALVVTDAVAAECLSQAYRCEVPTQAASRVLGRTCVAFREFEDMLGSPDLKQQAWALLKHLPRWDAMR
ncbi:MAG: hypothetical protein Q4D06_06710 [Coriobacteriia bacterium]|nr:hypothetical protein [Coriobacteriia bacterium]